jgi:hypothetical protein
LWQDSIHVCLLFEKSLVQVVGFIRNKIRIPSFIPQNTEFTPFTCSEPRW